MTPDDVNARSTEIAGTWANDWLRELIAHLAAAFAQLGQPLRSQLHLPDALTHGEAVAVERWLVIHVDDGDADPGDDRWFAELVAAKPGDPTLLYLFGRRAHPAVQLSPYLDGPRLRSLWWAAHGWRLPHALARLQASGQLDPLPPPDELERQCDLGRGRREEGEMLEKALARYGRCLVFDVEFGGQPVPHDQLVADFGKASRGAFAPTAIRQTRPSDEMYEIEFTHAGTRHVFEAQWQGDQYDDVAVAAACNAALAAAGQSERFHKVSGLDRAAYVFGDAALLRDLDNELCLGLDNAGRYARLQQQLA